MPVPYRGGCQCGAVRYQISEEPLALYVCHCTNCQHQSASAFGMSLKVKSTSARFTKGTLKTFQLAGDSGQPKTGAFCPDCGTRLYHSAGPTAPSMTIKHGTLDDKYAFKPTAHIWMRSKQPWVSVPDGMPQFEKGPTDPAAIEKAWAAQQR